MLSNYTCSMAIDWDAYIINRTLGTDVPTSVAGSSVVEQQRAPETPRDRRLRGYGMLLGVVAFLAWTILRMV
jgi:hypothetical protein